MLEGAGGTITVPVPAYLVVHPQGTVVFDSGLNPAARDDAAGYLGEFLAAFHDVHYGAGEDLAARLAAVGVDPAGVGHVINSHLHFDHCGGNAQLPNADVIVQRAEWERAHTENAQYLGYLGADFSTGQRIVQIDGEYDVFGDGSVVCVPTPGHTPGHQSLRVRTDQGEYVLCGDACYLRESLDRLRLPGIVADRDAALESLLWFQQRREQGAMILFGHDPGFWQTVPQAPAPLTRPPAVTTTPTETGR